MVSKKKILHIIEDLNIGGAERVLESIVQNLSAENFEVSILCLCDGGRIFDKLKKNFDIKISDFSKTRGVFRLITLVKEINCSDADIVHCHGVTANGWGRLAGFFSKSRKIFIHLHTTSIDRRLRVLYKEKVLYRITDRIIACSKMVAEDYRCRYGDKGKKIKVLYNSVLLNEQKDKNYSSTFRIGCVASLNVYKGHKYLLEALNLIVSKYDKPLSLNLVGTGKEESALKNLTKQLNLEDKVVFHGEVENVYELISSFDVVVLPSSEREGLGLSLLEAMACGKPVIGTRLGGIPEVIDDGENGFVVEPADSQALADALFKLASNKDLCIKMGKNSIKKIASRFSLIGMIDELENIYEEAMR